jgi:endo-1,4-beta-xylanase
MTTLHSPLRTALGLLLLVSLGCGGSDAPGRRDTSPSSADPQTDDDDADDDDDDVVADDDVEPPPTRGDGAVARDASSGQEAPRDAGRALDGGVRAPNDASVDAASSAPPAAADAAADARVDASSASDGGSKPRTTKMFVGNITTRGRVRDDFAMFWNQITPENEGKWGSVESVRDRMDWSGVDRAHTYAKQHGIIFKQHTFVWGSQQPGWLAGLAASEQRAEVEEWIRLFCERYPDVELIDVVNEPPPHTNPVYAQALGGAGASGFDWIVQSFKWARQYCPKAVLILNDYNNIEYTADANRFIDIAKRVKAAGAPIDAVGAQAHDAYKHPTNTVKQFLDRLASETGLPVYITEYDINEANETKQAEIMKSQFTMFWNHPAVKGVTLWGYVAGATWVPNSGLMSESGQQRAAMKWLIDFTSQ